MSTHILAAALLLFNEIVASNIDGKMSPATNFDSWVELYNPGEEAVDLGGMYLSNDPTDPLLWQMPADMGVVPAGGFKVVWLGSHELKPTQAPFKLSCDGGVICLSDSMGRQVACEYYPEAMSRTAWARTADGAGTWGWTATPTPDRTNSTAAFASERLAAPAVDTDSRLFTGTLQVSVDIPEGARLMYTTDGSLPTDPQWLADGVEPDGSTGTSKESTDGKFSIRTTTNLRLRLFREGYLPSVPVTRSYICTSRKYTVPVVSIVGDRRYFSDDTWGIDCDGTNGRPGNGLEKPKNYNMPWDRPVNFSYMLPDGTMAFNQDAEISVAGGWTRKYSPRTMKLKSGKEFDGQNRFDYPFFPQKPYIRNKALLVRNGGNDVWEHHARFMDPAVGAILQRSGIDIDVQSCVQVIEYVNGAYRGTLNLREPSNKHFVAANYGYSDEEIDMFDNFVFNCGDDSVLQRIYELGRHINDVGAYDELLRLLDIDEFTNYMAAELFVGNSDWPTNNIKGYRRREDGRFRFICYDLDYAFKRDEPFTAFAGFDQQDFVAFFLNMLAHDGYRKKFVDTFCIMGGSVFESGHAMAVVSELAAAMTPMSQFDGYLPGKAVNTLQTKLDCRMDTMTVHMQAFEPLRLSDTRPMRVQLQADASAAQLFINGIAVPYASFDGWLYAPVQVEAMAPAGYRFTGWKDGSVVLSEEPLLALPADADSLSLTATFELLNGEERSAEGIAPVRVNEVSAANSIYVNDHWKRNDWVELYNTTSEPVDVAGMYISDDAGQPRKCLIGKGDAQSVATVIPPHGHLVVWCDKLEPLSQLHASFKLSAEEGEVLLTAADGTWTDRLHYIGHDGDQSVGRYPDGGSDVMLMNVPTIGKANRTSTYATVVEQPDRSAIAETTAGHNESTCMAYAVGQIRICTPYETNATLTIYTPTGLLVETSPVRLANGCTYLPVSHLSAGCYIARLVISNGMTTAIKFALTQ